MSLNIDKNKLKLVQEDQIIFDEAIQTKGSGYYRDAWKRFKRNRASFVAFIILAILFFLTLIGPYISGHHSSTTRTELSATPLPPRMRLFEGIGILDGKKTIKNVNESRLQALQENGIFISFKDVNVDPTGTKVYDVKVDYYKYVNYQLIQTEYQVSQAELDVLIHKTYYESHRVDGNTIYLTVNNGFGYMFDNEEVDFMPYYWFGTDMRGRDVFSNLWMAARISFIVAFSVSIINIIIGIILGAIAGYYGGNIDLVMERIIEIISGIPFMAVLTLMILRFGQQGNNFWIVIFAFTVTGWIGVYGMVRTQFYRYKNREYVLAARTLGASDIRIMRRHIFSNALGTIVTSLVLFVPSIIFTEATYSFLGIIDYGASDSIGRMLSIGQDPANMEFNSHLLLFPSIFISLLMLSFNLFGNGLRDAFNPSLRGTDS